MLWPWVWVCVWVYMPSFRQENSAKLSCALQWKLRTVAVSDAGENWTKFIKSWVSYRGKNWAALGNLGSNKGIRAAIPPGWAFHSSWCTSAQEKHWEATATAPAMNQRPFLLLGHHFQRPHICSFQSKSFQVKPFLKWKAKPILNDQNLKINLFQLPLTKKCLLILGCLIISQMNFCVTSQYMAEIEMKYENSVVNGSLKHFLKKRK